MVFEYQLSLSGVGLVKHQPGTLPVRGITAFGGRMTQIGHGHSSVFYEDPCHNSFMVRLLFASVPHDLTVGQWWRVDACVSGGCCVLSWQQHCVPPSLCWVGHFHQVSTCVTNGSLVSGAVTGHTQHQSAKCTVPLTACPMLHLSGVLCVPNYSTKTLNTRFTANVSSYTCVHWHGSPTFLWRENESTVLQ